MLQSSDGQTYKVDLEIAKESGIIRTMLDTLRLEEEVVQLPDVNSKTLEKIVEWAYQYKDKPCGFTYEFLENLDGQTLLELIKAAVYLDIRRLKVYTLLQKRIQV